jgi:hypothetical protein
MDKIASGVRAADPNDVNGLMFARGQQGPGDHLASDCCLLSVADLSAGGDRHVHFVYLFYWSLQRLETAAVSGHRSNG